MHCQHTTWKQRSDKKKQKVKKLKQVTQNSKKQKQSLTQAKMDPLRQGQRLDAIDQKPQHDSSKTEVMLDAVMQEAEGKREKTRSQEQSRNSPSKAFPSHKCNSPKMMHSQSPVHNKFFKKSNKSPPCSTTSLKIPPLVGTCTHQGYKDLELPLKLRLPLNRCYAMNAMQEV